MAFLCLTRPLVSIFARPDHPVYDQAVTRNSICTIILFFIGFNIFAGRIFTALSNGIVSAVPAFSRSFVFMLAAMLALFLVPGVDGICLAVLVAELTALALSAFMLLKYKKEIWILKGKILSAVTFRGHLFVILYKKAEEDGYEKDFAGRGRRPFKQNADLQPDF